MVIKEAFEVATELASMIIPYLTTTEFMSLFICFGFITVASSYIFGCLISFGYGAAKFIFETLFRLIKGVIKND